MCTATACHLQNSRRAMVNRHRWREKVSQDKAVCLHALSWRNLLAFYIAQMTKGNLLTGCDEIFKRGLTVLIESYPSTRPIAILRLNNKVRPTIYQ